MIHVAYAERKVETKFDNVVMQRVRNSGEETEEIEQQLAVKDSLGNLKKQIKGQIAKAQESPLAAQLDADSLPWRRISTVLQDLNLEFRKTFRERDTRISAFLQDLFLERCSVAAKKKQKQKGLG